MTTNDKTQDSHQADPSGSVSPSAFTAGIVERLEDGIPATELHDRGGSVIGYDCHLGNAEDLMDEAAECITDLLEALKPFAAIAAPRHPIEEPNGPSAIDLMTCNGEYDELGMTSYTGAGPGAVILDGDWFRKARAAISKATSNTGVGNGE